MEVNGVDPSCRDCRVIGAGKKVQYAGPGRELGRPAGVSESGREANRSSGSTSYTHSGGWLDWTQEIEDIICPTLVSRI